MSSDISNRRTEVLYAPNYRSYRPYKDVANKTVDVSVGWIENASIRQELMECRDGEGSRKLEEEKFESDLVSHRLLNESGFFTVPEAEKFNQIDSEDEEIGVGRDIKCNRQPLASTDLSTLKFVNNPDENKLVGIIWHEDSNNNKRNFSESVEKVQSTSAQWRKPDCVSVHETAESTKKLQAVVIYNSTELIHAFSADNDLGNNLTCDAKFTNDNNSVNSAVSRILSEPNYDDHDEDLDELADINCLIESLPRLKVTKPAQLHSETAGAFMEYNRSAFGSALRPCIGAIPSEAKSNIDDLKQSSLSVLPQRHIMQGHAAQLFQQPQMLQLEAETWHQIPSVQLSQQLKLHQQQWQHGYEEESSLDGSEIFEASFCSVDSTMTERSFESLPKIFYDPSIHRGPVPQVLGNVGNTSEGPMNGVKLVVPISRPMQSMILSGTSGNDTRADSCKDVRVRRQVELSLTQPIICEAGVKLQGSRSGSGSASECRGETGDNRSGLIQSTGDDNINRDEEPSKYSSVLKPYNGLDGRRFEERKRLTSRVPSSRTMTRLTFTSPSKSRSTSHHSTSSRPTFMSPKRLRRCPRHTSGVLGGERDVVSEFIRHLRNSKSQGSLSSSAQPQTVLGDVGSSSTLVGNAVSAGSAFGAICNSKSNVSNKYLYSTCSSTFADSAFAGTCDKYAYSTCSAMTSTSSVTNSTGICCTSTSNVISSLSTCNQTHATNNAGNDSTDCSVGSYQTIETSDSNISVCRQVHHIPSEAPPALPPRALSSKQAISHRAKALPPLPSGSVNNRAGLKGRSMSGSSRYFNTGFSTKDGGNNNIIVNSSSRLLNEDSTFNHNSNNSVKGNKSRFIDGVGRCSCLKGSVENVCHGFCKSTFSKDTNHTGCLKGSVGGDIGDDCDGFRKSNDIISSSKSVGSETSINNLHSGSAPYNSLTSLHNRGSSSSAITNSSVSVLHSRGCSNATKSSSISSLHSRSSSSSRSCSSSNVLQRKLGAVADELRKAQGVDGMMCPASSHTGVGGGSVGQGVNIQKRSRSVARLSNCGLELQHTAVYATSVSHRARGNTTAAPVSRRPMVGSATPPPIKRTCQPANK